MADTPATPPFDETRAHRWFAVEANNLAWDLVEAAAHPAGRSVADTERMLHSAHTAAFHWQAVGTPLNRLRAVCLLTTAYVSAGRLPEAALYAEQALPLLGSVEGVTPFDRATVLAASAAAFAADRSDESIRLRRDALIAARLLDADDRVVFDRFYP